MAYKEMETERSLKYGLMAGLAAGAMMTLVMIVLRFTLDTVSIPEVLAERLIEITPGRVFSTALGVLEAKAKPILFISLLVGQVLVGGSLGQVYTLILEPVPFYSEHRWPRAVAFGIALWLLTMVVVTPLAGGGFFGGSLNTGQLSFLVASGVPYLVYGWLLSSAYQDLLRRIPLETAPQGRRYFLKWATLGVAALAVGTYAARLLVERGPSTTAGGISSEGMPLEVTPNEEFYTVSKNFVDPAVPQSGWELRVEGLVERPFSLSYEELKALPWVEEYITLECISNRVGGGLISNARWRGIPLRTLLERAGLRDGVVDIASFAADGYSESMPLEMALEPQVLVAYLMNDEPLPRKHGFPARIVVPGLYGEKSTKWLTKLEAVDHDFLGFWQQNGWGDGGLIQATSQIRVPGGRVSPTDGSILVGGIAFTG
ncbi:MAG: molybdopterin-dependent oxidoreductase, partial [Chloroflexi bacterium]|nr:molybdopterin-dependent oxidoreductase [Chloroflexota bacterium]